MPTIILTIFKSDFSPSNWHWKQQHDITHASNFTNKAVHIHRTKSTFCVLITIMTHWNSEIQKGYYTHQLLELFQVILYFCYLHMIPGPYRIRLKGLTSFLVMYRNNITSVIVLYEVFIFLSMKQIFFTSQYVTWHPIYHNITHLYNLLQSMTALVLSNHTGICVFTSYVINLSIIVIDFSSLTSLTF